LKIQCQKIRRRRRRRRRRLHNVLEGFLFYFNNQKISNKNKHKNPLKIKQFIFLSFFMKISAISENSI
jgi:hypothetical protein